MSEVMNEQPVVEQQSETPEIDYKAFYEANKESIEKLPGLVKKNQELLSETKQAKAERMQAAAEAQRIADEKALKDGEYEKLWKTAKEEKDSLAKQIADLKNNNKKERIQISALKISNELAEGANVELLSDFVMRKLEALAEDDGSLSDDVILDVKNQFATNNKYQSLLKQSKASGGSAPGNARGAPAETKTISRSDFENLSQYDRGQFFAKGGKLVD